MSDLNIPGIWSKKLTDEYLLNSAWRDMVDKMAMMPIKGRVRGESWQSALNRFVASLNDEHERKLHPERYYE